jgi:hypothetical protein
LNDYYHYCSLKCSAAEADFLCHKVSLHRNNTPDPISDHVIVEDGGGIRDKDKYSV